LSRAERQLERQARKIETLKARADLNAGRLSTAGTDPAPARKSQRKLDGEAALRAKVVRQRKGALKYSVERLEMEVGNKERELRMRLDQGGR
jgi:DASH complex subunit SPC19